MVSNLECWSGNRLSISFWAYNRYCRKGEYRERIWLENYKASRILFYRPRYVDDTFCLFDTEQDAILFLDYISDRHPNIRFTMENETDKRIHFLDRCCDWQQSISIPHYYSVYRKKTFTGLLTNCFSLTPLSYKLGLIKIFVNRTYKINNTWAGFHDAISLRGSSASISPKLKPIKFQVKIKEALHIHWEKPSLNKQLYNVNLTLSF